MRKTAALITLIIILALAVAACTQGNIPQTQSVDEVVYGPTFAPEIAVTRDEYMGMLAVGNRYTIGLHASGDIVIAGECDSVRADIDGIENVVYIASSSDTVVCLKENGTLTVSGADKDRFSAAMLWDNIVSVAIGDNHLVAVTSYGYPLHVGDDAYGQSDVMRDYGVKKVAVSGNFTVVLRQDGTLGFYGERFYGYNSILTVTDAKDVVAGKGFFAVLDEYGNVKSTSGKTCEGACRIFAGDTDFIATDENGDIIYAPKSIKNKGFKNIASIAVGKNHIAAMSEAGEVTAKGEKKYGAMRDVSLWRLRLNTLESGYITGFFAGESVEKGKLLVTKALSKDAVLSCAGEYVATGDKVKCKDGTEYTVLIYGDVTGDGLVTSADTDALDKYIAGEKTLDGAFLAASDTLHYVGGCKPVGEEHAAALHNVVENGGSVKQYWYDPYAKQIADVYAFNQDIVGWISIDGTNIDYPIMYGADFYYHYYNINKRQSGLGSIYRLYEAVQKNTAVAGHNGRVRKRMFNQLHNVQDDKEALLDYNNRVWGITIGNSYELYEVFALYETASEEPKFTNRYNTQRLNDAPETELQTWIDEQLRRSEIDLGVNVTTEDSFVTLYTCGDKYDYNRDGQSRLYIFLRRVG